MKCGARVALGVAGGYFLGRTKKMKLALMLGTIAAGRRIGGPGELLGQATKLLSASPELTRLTDEVKGRLFEAGKGAALAVAARQVESITDRVGKRVESIGDTTKGSSKRGRKARPERESDYDEQEEYDEDQYEDEYDDSPAESDGDSSSESDSDEVDEGDVADGEDDDRPSPRSTSRQSRSSAGRAAKGSSDRARRTASKATAGARSGRSTRSRRSNDA